MKANEYLKEKNIGFELVEQDNPTKDCDEAAKERGVETSQIVKSLIIERNQEKGQTQNSETVHALLPGDREVSEKKFGEHRMISPEKSLELTGFERGKVHPFSTDIKHVVDYRLLEKDNLSFTIGETLKGVIIDKDKFREALDQSKFNYQVADISLHNQRDLERLQERGLNQDQAKFTARNGLTPIYLEIESQDSEQVYKVLEELERHQAEYETSQIKEILDIVENQNHLQKIVEEFAKTGEIPETNQDYNLDKILQELEKQNPKPFQQYREGKESAINYIIGKVMERTQGQAQPEQIKNKIK